MNFITQRLLGTERHSTATWIKLIVVIVICVFLVGAVLVSISGASGESSRSSSLILYNTTTELPPTSANSVFVYVDVSSINLEEFSVRTRTDFICSGIYGNGNTFNQTVTFVQDSAVKIIPAQMNPSPLFNPAFLYGDVNLYPFDIYTSVIDLKMFQNGTTIFDGIPVPFSVVFSGARTGYDFSATTISTSGNFTGGQASIFLDLRRSTSVKTLVMITVAFQWLIAISSFGVAVDILIRKRAIHPSLLVFFGVMIIALPALRNSQPNAPPIGTFTDIFGFEWNMIILSVSFVISCVLFVFRFRKEEAPASKPVDKPKEVDEKPIDKVDSV